LPTLNLGVVAHVDAGKTSLTEQLLFHTGVIDRPGRVDDGTTQTDGLALERARGITIRAAVASFRLGDLVVNLIDTPGHPDFIAEVERSLAVLDGAVLVVSAAAGVQAQTRVLFRALRRLGLPVIIFVNKIDISQHPTDEVVEQIRRRLVAPLVVLQQVRDPGEMSASVLPTDPYAWLDPLSDSDPDLLRHYVDDPTTVATGELRASLARAARSGAAVPVLFGSAATGAGVPELVEQLPRLLPVIPDRSGGPLAGTVFKIDTEGGTRSSYVRLSSGRLHLRERLRSPSARRGGKITGIEVYDGGPPVPAEVLTAGQIGRLRGPSELRIGDPLGEPDPRRRWAFDRPTLETVISADPPSQAGALFAALTELSAQDPLIGVRRQGEELRVSLFGEVQKEVIEATLAAEYGLRVGFAPTTVVCIERLRGVGEAVEVLHDDGNPFLAGIGLRVAPAPVGSGISYQVAGDRLGTMPPAFFRAVAETVPEALQHGPNGWPVHDCAVTLVATGYAPRQSHAHATFDKSMSSTGRDFRHLTPLVLAEALTRAGTMVCEPVQRVRLEIPEDTVTGVLSAVVAASGVPSAPTTSGDLVELEALVPARTLHALTQQLPGLTRGEAVVESAFDHHAPSRSFEVLQGPRPDPDPYHRRAYLLARAGARYANRV
jgi:ribosomal protection tetracycline resistance protein